LVESYSIACLSTPIFVLAAHALRLSLRHGHRLSRDLGARATPLSRPTSRGVRPFSASSLGVR
jgi:hypothetical protein